MHKSQKEGSFPFLSAIYIEYIFSSEIVLSINLLHAHSFEYCKYLLSYVQSNSLVVDCAAFLETATVYLQQHCSKVLLLIGTVTDVMKTLRLHNRRAYNGNCTSLNVQF